MIKWARGGRPDAHATHDLTGVQGEVSGEYMPDGGGAQFKSAGRC